jgi:hypothetical protein
VLAGGLIYFSSEDGATTVIRPGAVYDPVAVNRLDAPILASIAVSERSLFVRTATHLYRVAVTSPGERHPVRPGVTP